MPRPYEHCAFRSHVASLPGISRRHSHPSWNSPIATVYSVARQVTFIPTTAVSYKDVSDLPPSSTKEFDNYCGLFNNTTIEGTHEANGNVGSSISIHDRNIIVMLGEWPTLLYPTVQDETV